MTGRLIAVVGPSGVGKDSVMSALAARRPSIELVRRVITRDPGLGGEDYEPVTEDRFAELLAADAFCLHWAAHGLLYGIPATVRDRLAEGTDLLVNLSRSVLPEMKRSFPTSAILSLTATPETLARRLQGRGRETPESIAKRLERSALGIPEGVPVIEISNDGSLAETVEDALDALYPVKV